MPLYHQDQSPLNYEAIMGAGNPVRELARAKCQIAIRSHLTGWQINNWRDGGGWELLPNQDVYVPTICVRAFTLYRTSQDTPEDWATVQYDAPGYGPDWQETNRYQIAIVNTLRTGVPYYKQITKLWLAGSESNFNYIYLDG
jgi:hypothetical protein